MDSSEIKLNGQCEHGIPGAIGCYQCSQNSLQQLKAEIRVLLHNSCSMSTTEFYSYIDDNFAKLLDLSAI